MTESRDPADYSGEGDAERQRSVIQDNVVNMGGRPPVVGSGLSTGQIEHDEERRSRHRQVEEEQRFKHRMQEREQENNYVRQRREDDDERWRERFLAVFVVFVSIILVWVIWSDRFDARLEELALGGLVSILTAVLGYYAGRRRGA